VRATATDGDAVAVREAIAMGIPVLATDCVPRPSECQLFKDGDRSKLRELLSAALISSAPLSEERGATTDNAERIADVYTSLFDE
jgi:ribosomal protein S2